MAQANQQLSADDLLSALPIAVFITDRDGFITAFNAAAVTLWGREPETGVTRWCGFASLLASNEGPMGAEASPCSIALSSQHDQPAKDAIGVRADGSRVAFAANARLLRDTAGEVIGTLTALTDLSHQPAEGILKPRFEAIIASSHDAIISKNLDGIITSWNRSAERVFGYTEDEIIGQSITVLIPVDRLDEEPKIIERIRNGDMVDHFETIRRRKDGSLVPISLTISPIRAEDGRIIGVSKIARDISDKYDAEKRIRMLLREVNHRVKNQFAVILSMIRETNRRTTDATEFERLVRERVMALSRSQDLLVHGDWRGADLADLVVSNVRATGDEDMLVISGEPLLLNPMATQHIGMALHELAMNSARRGVLAKAAGRIKVNWLIDRRDDLQPTLKLSWSEPHVHQELFPEQGGFGTLVLTRVTPGSVSGRADLSFDGERLVWTLEAPLASLESSGEELPFL